MIVSVSGKPTPTTDVLSAVLATLKPGKTVPVGVRHQNGKKDTLRVTLATYPGG